MQMQTQKIKLSNWTSNVKIKNIDFLLSQEKLLRN
jgi:hypothetical protein